MSIPGNSIKIGRNPPILRQDVGGSIKAIVLGHSFDPGVTILAVDGDEEMFFHSPVMWGVCWQLSGITKDSTGAVLGSCHVDLFYTRNDVLAGETTSDPTTGAFSFLIGPNAGTFFLVAYKPGSPDVAGTTINTLMPVAA